MKNGMDGWVERWRDDIMDLFCDAVDRDSRGTFVMPEGEAAEVAVQLAERIVEALRNERDEAIAPLVARNARFREDLRDLTKRWTCSWTHQPESVLRLTQKLHNEEVMPCDCATHDGPESVKAG